MKSIVAILVISVFGTLVSCSNNNDTNGQPSNGDLVETDTASAVSSPVLYAYTYECASGATFEVSIDPVNNTAVLLLDSMQYTLKQDTAASGTRYTNDTLVFWSKGESAFIMIRDVVRYRNCGIVPRSAEPSDSM